MTTRADSSHHMPTSLRGRLRNTRLPDTKALLPLFEAIVNSIHAIEDAAVPPPDQHITVRIIRDTTLEFSGPQSSEEILGFTITDNGIGFTDDNMESFRVLDSDYKIAKGGRGIGRLIWLKAFENVRVDSRYHDRNDRLTGRTFSFNAAKGIHSSQAYSPQATVARETSVHLDGFAPRYRKHCRKKLSTIAHQLFEHCLWYFIRPGGAPHIKLTDGEDTLLLREIYETQMLSSASSESVAIKGVNFDLAHMRLRGNSLSTHTVSWCADNRVVSEENLSGKLPGLYGKISDHDGAFIYSCYVSSSFFDENVRPERTGFDAIERTDTLFADSEISLDDVREVVLERAENQLSEHMADSRRRSTERIKEFVERKAPRYRFIVSRVPERDLSIDPQISDRDLEIFLHRHYAKFESDLLAEGHNVMETLGDDTFEEYEARLADYISKSEDLKMSDLASYVSHRRVIVDLFEKAIERNPDGTYVREDLIHSLIMIKGTTSNDVTPESCNLWLIDERLAFHHYLSSDKPLRSISVVDSDSGKKPDIFALHLFDQPLLVSETGVPSASLDIVEIKRPMRADAAAGEEHDPIEQAVGYLRRIREGRILTEKGRPIPPTRDVPGFCYILADLTDRLRERCEDHHDLRVTADGLGYFGYKSNANVYIEVISFDGLVKAAKVRNRAFFDNLGLPSN